MIHYINDHTLSFYDCFRSIYVEENGELKSIKAFGQIFRIDNFFSRVDKLIQKHIIDKDVVVSLLLTDFNAWNNKYLTHQSEKVKEYLKNHPERKEDGWEGSFGPYPNIVKE